MRMFKELAKELSPSVNVTPTKLEEYFQFLDNLRDSGVTNMLGAVPYLVAEYPNDLNEGQALKVLSSWFFA